MLPLLDLAAAAGVALTKTKRKNRVVKNASLAMPKTVDLKRRVAHVRQVDTKMKRGVLLTLSLPIVNHALQEKNLVLRLPSAMHVPPASIKINPTCTYIPTTAQTCLRMLH